MIARDDAASESARMRSSRKPLRAAATLSRFLMLRRCSWLQSNRTLPAPPPRRVCTVCPYSAHAIPAGTETTAARRDAPRGVTPSTAVASLRGTALVRTGGAASTARSRRTAAISCVAAAARRAANASATSVRASAASPAFVARVACVPSPWSRMDWYAAALRAARAVSAACAFVAPTGRGLTARSRRAPMAARATASATPSVAALVLRATLARIAREWAARSTARARASAITPLSLARASRATRDPRAPPARVRPSAPIAECVTLRRARAPALLAGAASRASSRSAARPPAVAVGAFGGWGHQRRMPPATAQSV